MHGMKYKVALRASEEGFAVSVPGLPGCWSQGTTEAEALENIKQAIEEYLAVVDGELKGATIREVEVRGLNRSVVRSSSCQRCASPNTDHSAAQPCQCDHDGRHRARCRADVGAVSGVVVVRRFRRAVPADPRGIRISTNQAVT